jgi:hypothetical protein
MDDLQPRPLRTDLLYLSAFASLIVIFHFVMGNGYGFHRDELQFLDDARHLHGGFVAYPPLTSFAGRLAIARFGISTQVLRLPSALVNATTLVLVGLTARELGAQRAAQLLTLLVVFPLALTFSTVLQYTTFDLFAWTVTILFTARVLRTSNPRNWIGVGIGIGLGVLSKYAIAFPLASLLAALVLLPSQRHHLRSRWFCYGALVATLISSPNLLWLAQHHFITLQMEHFIHARDIRQGRASHFFSDQLKFTLFALPLNLAGLVWLLRSPRFRLLTCFYLGPLFILILLKGLGYYLMPAYPILSAAGAVALQTFLRQRSAWLRIPIAAVVVLALLANTAVAAWAYAPIFPVHSVGWNWQMRNNHDVADEIGWPEFVAEVAAVRDALPPADRTRLAILAYNYGEAGALSLYGPQYGLPTPISGVNSFHDRGYGPYEPDTVIITGGDTDYQFSVFATCRIAAKVHIPYGVLNEESRDHQDILVCHHLRSSWPAFWSDFQLFA